MSTKSTIYYDEETDIHVYVELLDNSIHVEYSKLNVDVDIEIVKFENWSKFAECVFQEFVRRQVIPRIPNDSPSDT